MIRPAQAKRHPHGRERTLREMLGIEHDELAARLSLEASDHRQKVSLSFARFGPARDELRLLAGAVRTDVIALQGAPREIEAGDGVPAEPDGSRDVERAREIQYRSEPEAVGIHLIALIRARHLHEIRKQRLGGEIRPRPREVEGPARQARYALLAIEG